MAKLKYLGIITSWLRAYYFLTMPVSFSSHSLTFLPPIGQREDGNYTFHSCSCLCIKEEDRLHMLDNGVLRRMSGRKRQEVTGVTFITKSVILLTCPQILLEQSRRMKWVVLVARTWKVRNTHKI